MRLVAVAVVTLLVGASAGEVSPVEKVVQMLEDLQTEVITEGKAEATTYDKFACFCKDTGAEKNAAITNAEDTVGDLEASINQLSSDREDLDTEISEMNAKIALFTKQMKEGVASRAEQKATYERELAELTKGLHDVDTAVDTLKQTSALVSVKSVVRTLRSSVLMADAMGHGPKTQKLLAELLQVDQPDVPMDAYETGKTGDIIDTVQGLSKDFIEKIAEVKAQEKERLAEFDLFMQAKTDNKKLTEKQLARVQETKSEKVELLAQANKDLTATSAQLLDDQTYIKSLTETCNLKSAQWDQRSQMRSEELTALSTALTIIKERVSLAQLSAPVRKSPLATQDAPVSEDAAEAAPSFLQLASPRSRLSLLSRAAQRSSPTDEKRNTIVALLRSRSKSLDSAVLAALASHVAADPFAKIKQLVQELIERLLQEAADEASHKGWCDKELGKAKQSRDTKVAAIAGLNSAIAANEAKRDKLAEDVSVLTDEIDELEASLEKMTKERKAESSENETTVKEAEEGKAAVEDAISVLDKFYKTAAKAALLQGSKAPEGMPDAGFDGSSTGSQDAATGVLGMLEVIQSDFARTIETTQKTEREAAAEFLAFETETKVSMGKKTAEKSNKDTELVETRSAISEDMESMKDEQTLLDKSIQELGELRPACIDTGMSYEDRVAKREQEIDSLKEALCTLDTEGPGEPTESC